MRPSGLTSFHPRRLLHVFPTFNVGGAQVRFVSIANHLGRDYEHFIYAMDGHTRAADGLSDETNATLLQIPVSGRSSLSKIIAFRRTLDRLAPDLLITSNWGSIEWAMANAYHRIPHIHMEDGFGPEEADHQLLRRVLARRLLLRRSRVIVPSRVLHRLACDVWRLPKENVAFIPNGIDCDRFAKRPDPAFAAAHGIDISIPIVGTVAALRPEKNISRLLEAFSQVARQHRAQLVIVGGGAEQASLSELAVARGIGDRVIFTGSSVEPEKFLSLFTIFALSSDTEQMPLSVLEAMAAGLPVAATDVGDISSMVAPDNLPFVVPKKVDQLGAAIGTLLSEPARAVSVGRSNAKRARELFDQKMMFARHKDLFDTAG